MANVTDTISEYHLNRNRPEKPQFEIYELEEYCRDNFEDMTRPHLHTFHQVIWFREGSGSHFVDFKRYDVAGDTVFFIAKNQVHYFDRNREYKGILIHFNESFLVQTDREVEFFLKCILLNNPYQSPACRIADSDRRKLETYLSQIQEEFSGSDHFGKEELLRSYLKAFLIQLQRFRNDSGQPVFVTDDKRMQLMRYIDLVNENYSKGVSVAGYAEKMHISSRALSGMTRQLLNKTPSQIILERIVLEAQRLLLHTDLNVSQIGFRLGFEDPSYFVKYFKKNTGMSPSGFRKSVS